jgi:alcohol dehydrogenase class IV
MEYNFEGFEHKFDRMAQALNIPSSKGGDVITYIHELNHSIGIPTKLSYAGVNIDHVDTLASLAYADFAHPNNPKPVTEADFKELYLKAL